MKEIMSKTGPPVGTKTKVRYVYLSYLLA